jgi:hypothetical protein
MAHLLILPVVLEFLSRFCVAEVLSKAMIPPFLLEIKIEQKVGNGACNLGQHDHSMGPNVLIDMAQAHLFVIDLVVGLHISMSNGEPNFALLVTIAKLSNLVGCQCLKLSCKSLRIEVLFNDHEVKYRREIRLDHIPHFREAQKTNVTIKHY